MAGDMRVKLTLDMINRLSGPARQAAGDLKGINVAAASLNSKGGSRVLEQRLQGIAKAAKESGAAIAGTAKEAGALERKGPGQKLRRDLAQIAREARQSHDRLSELGRTLQRLERVGPNQRLRHDLAQIAREARRADDALGHVGSKAMRLQRANIGGTMQRSLADIAREADRARRAMAGANNEAARLGRHRGGGGGGGTGSTPVVVGDDGVGGSGNGGILAIGGRFAAAGGALYAGREVARQTAGRSISFESAFADVKKKVDLPEGRSWDEIERQITSAAFKYGRGRGEVAALTANLGASGVPFEELAAYIELATKTGVSWDMSADDASGELMKQRAGLGWSLPELQDYGDKVNALGDASNALERDIAEMFGRASGGAAAAGVSTDVTLAGLTALNSVGVQPEIASRFFSQFSAKLAMAAGDDPDKWAAAGLDNKAVSKGMRTNSFETMTKVLDAIASKANAAELAVDIFGEGWWDEAMRLQRAIPEWRRMMDLLNDPAKWRGSQQAALNVELATSQNHINRLLAAADKVGDSLGRWTLPHINEGANQFVAWVDSLSGRATALDAIIERFRTLKQLTSGSEEQGDSSRGFMSWASDWEKDSVERLSGGESDAQYLGNYLDEVVFGREGDGEQRLMRARVQAWADHQAALNAEADKAIAREAEARDKLVRLRHERERAVAMGIDTGVLDFQLGRAETDLDAKSQAAESARRDKARREQKTIDDSVDANRKLTTLQRQAAFTLLGGATVSDNKISTKMQADGLTRQSPDLYRLQADGLPAAVGGFGVSGHQQGYTEKPAPARPVAGWGASDSGGFSLAAPPAAPRFGLSGFTPQPGAGESRMRQINEALQPEINLGYSIADQIAASIEAAGPRVTASAQAVADNVRAALGGGDFASSARSGMDAYAASIAANGERAVVAAQSVGNRVKAALSVNASVGISASGASPGRINGALHDVPTGAP